MISNVEHSIQIRNYLHRKYQNKDIPRQHTHCGLLTSYENTDIDHHWLRSWQIIIWHMLTWCQWDSSDMSSGECWIKVQSINDNAFKMSSSACLPFCWGLNILTLAMRNLYERIYFIEMPAYVEHVSSHVVDARLIISSRDNNSLFTIGHCYISQGAMGLLRCRGSMNFVQEPMGWKDS